MFYVYNVKQWLDEVVSACSENSLDPEDSVFVLLMFSSLDFDFVTFFRGRKPQISQYSGENVHIFTPMIFDEDVVPDGEWRLIRDGFSDAGIPLSNRPSVILFHLRKRSEATGYDPHFFAAFELPAFNMFERGLRDFVDACIAHRKDESRLTRELGILFRAPNRVENVSRVTPLSGSPITSVLHAPKVFISYSHADKQSVLDLYHQLKDSGAQLWLDQFELSPGVVFQQEIEHALKASDAVLMVLSRNSNSSKWVSFEGSFFYGQSKEKLIIPVVLDGEGKSLANELPFLKGRLYIDLSNTEAWYESVAKLSSVLSDLQRGEQQHAPDNTKTPTLTPSYISVYGTFEDGSKFIRKMKLSFIANCFIKESDISFYIESSTLIAQVIGASINVSQSDSDFFYISASGDKLILTPKGLNGVWLDSNSNIRVNIVYDTKIGTRKIDVHLEFFRP